MHLGNLSSFAGLGNFKKPFYIFIFFTITPLTLVSCLLSLISIGKITKENKVLGTNNYSFKNNLINSFEVYSAETSKLPAISAEIITDDARPNIIKNYLLKYHSPLAPYADIIVIMADKYDIDYRLTTAIAQQESNLCKKMPEESYNCWGWGIHSQGTLKFTSYEEAIEAVTEGIKTKYLDKGYASPEEIMAKYTPLSSGSWAFGVSAFMDQLQ